MIKKVNIPFRKLLLYASLVMTFMLSGNTHGRDLSVVTIVHPPNSYLDDEEVSGASTELVTKILMNLGLKPRISILPPKRALRSIELGKADVIYAYTFSEQRGKFAFYSHPIAVINSILFKSNKRDIHWETFQDLKPYRIGGNAGYNYNENFLSAVKEHQLSIEYAHTQNPTLLNLNKLLHGRIDLFLCNYDLCQYYINKHKPEYDSIDFIEKTVGPINTFHVGFSRKTVGASDIRDKFNIELGRMIHSGELEEIYERYGVKVDVDQLQSKSMATQ